METVKQHITYIYILIDPTTETVRYVGKADDPVNRLKIHLSETNLKVKSPKNSWLKSLLRENKTPVMEVVKTVAYQERTEWEYWEKLYIAQYRQQVDNLTNMTEGGEGFASGALNPTKRPEVQAKIQKYRIGRKHSEKTKKILREKRLGPLNGMYGKPGSELQKETIKKMRKGKTYEEIYGLERAIEEKAKRKRNKNI